MSQPRTKEIAEAASPTPSTPEWGNYADELLLQMRICDLTLKIRATELEARIEAFYRELYVSILGNRRLQVLPIREVIFSEVPEGRPRFSTFKAKWDDAYRQRWGIQNIFAQPLPEGIAERIAQICKKVYRVLRIRGYGRIDLRVAPDGDIVILEANPNPNLADDDEFAQSALKAGLTYEGVIQRVLALALSA